MAKIKKNSSNKKNKNSKNLNHQKNHETDPSHLEPGPEGQNLIKVMAEVGTGIWRIEKRIKSYNDLQEETREKLLNPIDSTIGALNRGGFEIIDPIGKKYNEGMALKATFQPSEDFEEKKIIDTLKPTIHYKNQIIQIGEVIVSFPMKINQEK